jgi:transcriptional regulator with XRE-family HTH domain
MRRKMLAMSQTELGDALGITYQQVQKNEGGTNRIGASRLQQISHILQVPIAFFFEGAPNASGPTEQNRYLFNRSPVGQAIPQVEQVHFGPRLAVGCSLIYGLRVCKRPAWHP